MTERLSDKRQVTLIMRLVLDRHGLLMHGEMADVQGTVFSRFVGWRGMVRALRAWLASQGEKE